MKISSIRRVLLEDLQGHGELPGWLDPFLSVMNQFIDSVGSALINRLDFLNNFYSKEISIKLTSGTSQKINPGQNVSVLGMLVVDVGGVTLTGQKMVRNSDGSVSVTLTWTEGGSSNCLLYLFLR